ncbi:subunit alpha of guanine nucleotide-binding protein [Chloropicon primus]|nr:subunit alpha of guanine nucleotide-binding protein [Chloropicon primus]
MGICASKNYYRIVLLGNVGSGKTTFCKQIVDSYLGGFSKSMKWEFRKHIQANILHRMVAMQSFEEFSDTLEEDEEFKRNFMVLQNATVADFDYSDDESNSFVQEVLDSAVYVGEHKVVQEICNALYLSAPWDFKYFRDVRRIFKNDYEPSKEDIFTCRKPTTGSCEYIIRHLHVQAKGNKTIRQEVIIEVIDVGGQRSERKSWEKQIELADGILYLVSMTDYAGKEGAVQDYYSYLSDNDKCNLKYTQELFKENFIIPKTRHIPIVLLETKVDLFRKMIEDNSPSMRECFPEYKGADGDYETACAFLTSQIKSKIKNSLNSKMLESKLERMPILRQNLTSKTNFALIFNRIWDKITFALQDITSIEKYSKSGQVRKSSAQEMIMKRQAVKTHRASITDLGNMHMPGTPKSKAKQKLNFRRSISVLTGIPINARGSGTASVEELISGNNSLNLQRRRDARNSVQGIVRSKSYHWN